MALDPKRAADDLEARLRAVGTSDRAEGERRYLKSELSFLGTSVSEVRREIRALAKANPELSHDEMVALVEELWLKPVFERRLAAAQLLVAHPALVGSRDLALLQRLVRESETWALVDVLAKNVIGELLVREPDAASRLDRWAGDDDFWVRRSALLAMIEPLQDGADFDRFAGYADSMLDEKEFFIRKAIGWVLRETGKRRSTEVFEWLAPRTDRVSGVTIREAVKYLEPDWREALMGAYREKRPAA